MRTRFSNFKENTPDNPRSRALEERVTIGAATLKCSGHPVRKKQMSV